MGNELTHREYVAVEEFANELKAHFKELMDKRDQILTMFCEYVTNIIDIHIKLAKLKFDVYDNNLVKS